MKNYIKFLIFALLTIFSACSKNDPDNSFQSYHLIDTYYDTTDAAVVADRTLIEVSFMSNNPQRVFHSHEYTNIAGISQSEVNAARFNQLAAQNNDYYKWQVPYITVGNNFSMAYSNAALVAGIRAIELTSDADYDESHPRGTSLTNMITLMIDSYGEHLGKDLTGTNTASNVFGEVTKSYRQFTERELSVVGPWMCISIDKLPTLAIKHKMTLTITFTNGDEFKKEINVNF